MKALFVCTGSTRISSDGIAYGYSLNYAVFSRYLAVFDEVLVMGTHVAEKASFAAGDSCRMEGPGVTFASLVERRNKLSTVAQRDQIKMRLLRALDRVDAVIVRLPSQIALLADALARRRSLPVLHELGGCPFDALWYHGHPAGKLLAPVAALQLRQAMSRASHAVYVTREFLQARYPTKGKSIACSDVVITSRDPDALERRLARIGAWSGDTSIKLGLMGSLDVAYKGHAVALKAVRRLKQMGHRISLRLAGGGDPARWRSLAERLGVAEQVEFCGLLSRSEVNAWLAETDIYLQPSRVEGLPRAVIEAMAVGCPVVGSTAGGIPELLGPDDVVPPNNDRALASRIATLISHPKMATEQARRNYAEAGNYLHDRLQARREAFLREWLEDACHG